MSRACHACTAGSSLALPRAGQEYEQVSGKASSSNKEAFRAQVVRTFHGQASHGLVTIWMHCYARPQEAFSER